MTTTKRPDAAVPPEPRGDAGRPQAGLGTRARRRARRLVRRAVSEVQFALLFGWFSVMGPPRVLGWRDEMNARLLRAFGAKVGRRDVRLHAPITINGFSDDYANLTIGNGVILNGNNFIDIHKPVTLEDGVSLGPGVVVMTHNSFNRNPFLIARLKRLRGYKPVTIRRSAGIKANAVILHGVTIGEEAVVAGGSIVSRDVPRRAYVSGVPAVVKKILDAGDGSDA